MDKIDQKILKYLQADGRMAITTLAGKVSLSKTPCLNRVRRLEKDGYIRGYVALLDHVKLGVGHIAFVEVKLTDTRTKALDAFNQAVIAIAEIEQCHMIAGGFDYLLKVRTRDIGDYRKMLGEKISSLPHVAHTSTYVAMESVKD